MDINNMCDALVGIVTRKQARRVQGPITSYHNVSKMRNQPCSCGSGKKFKHCDCGRQARAEQIRGMSR
jgi:uncharacterized protein YecA (UPF0149 family)